jgi:hypothetical protein
METLTVRASSIPTSAAGRRGPQATTGVAFAGRVLPGEGPVATSVKVVELCVAELATDQAALGVSCRVSLAGGGLSNSPMASTPM